MNRKGSRGCVNAESNLDKRDFEGGGGRERQTDRDRKRVREREAGWGVGEGSV